MPRLAFVTAAGFEAGVDYRTSDGRVTAVYADNTSDVTWRVRFVRDNGTAFPPRGVNVPPGNFSVNVPGGAGVRVVTITDEDGPRLGLEGIQTIEVGLPKAGR